VSFLQPNGGLTLVISDSCRRSDATETPPRIGDSTYCHLKGMSASTSQSCHEPLTTSVVDRVGSSSDHFRNRLNAVARTGGFVLSKDQRRGFDFRGCQVT
jgi:hypothetical protein